MFLKNSRCKILEQYEAFSKEFPDVSQEINNFMGDLNEDEVLGLKYLYANMPLSDVGNYSVNIYLDYVRHGLYLWENSAFAKRMPEEIFRNYVLYHRVNEEEIKPCRPLFWNQLRERIKNLDMKEAILEINYWCAEEVTYQSTDARTSSALDVYLCGFGRCGEESVFAVNALRSAGIPARQVYAPRWAHCDDNHAWVEVWCDEEWHYLGACEPEMVLDKGWFNNAASRAMMVNSRWFEREAPVEEVIGKEGINLMLNQLPRYANTKRITIKVKNIGGIAVPGAKVRAEVLNYSEFTPVAEMITDENGKVSLTTGLGSLHISASGNGGYGEGLIDTREGDTFECIMEEEFVRACRMNIEKIAEKKVRTRIEKNDVDEDKISLRTGWIDFDMAAPKDCWAEIAHARGQDDERPEIAYARGQGNERPEIAYRREQDNDRIDIVYRRRENNKAKTLGNLSEELHNSRIAFAREKCRKKREQFCPAWKGEFLADKPQLAEKMMAVLSEKDRRDVSSEVLREHYEGALMYQKEFQEELFLSYVWNPRVEDEILTAWRRKILNFFTEKQKIDFRKNPRNIWHWIEKNIIEKEDRERLSVYTTPAAALDMKAAGKRSKKILFVAIARTLGIPARLDEQDKEMGFWNGGCFVPVNETGKKESYITISGAGDTVWSYFSNWSLARKTEEGYVSLKLPGKFTKEGKLELDVEPGQYRILTSNRVPAGNIFAKRYDFCIERGESRSIVLELREVELKDMLSSYRIPDFTIYKQHCEGNILKNRVLGGTVSEEKELDKSVSRKKTPEEKEPGKPVSGERVLEEKGLEGTGMVVNSLQEVTIAELTKEDRRILFWLDVGKEPTEHILNELIEHQTEYKMWQKQLFFIVRNREALADGTLKKCRSVLPDIQICYDSFGKNREMTARKMYTDPDKLPLMVVTDGLCTGIFAASGYAVGMADLLLRILKITAQSE